MPTLLRLATAGSVDDGKSTLVGRLLHDTKSVLADQLAAVERVIERVHGQKPVRVGIGGTLPVSPMVKQILGLETVTLSYAIADEQIHAPNEFFRLARLQEGAHAWTAYFEALARTRDPAARAGR